MLSSSEKISYCTKLFHLSPENIRSLLSEKKGEFSQQVVSRIDAAPISQQNWTICLLQWCDTLNSRLIHEADGEIRSPTLWYPSLKRLFRPTTVNYCVCILQLEEVKISKISPGETRVERRVTVIVENLVPIAWQFVVNAMILTIQPLCNGKNIVQKKSAIIQCGCGTTPTVSQPSKIEDEFRGTRRVRSWPIGRNRSTQSNCSAYDLKWIWWMTLTNEMNRELTRIDDVGTELQYEQEENFPVYRRISLEFPPLTFSHQEQDGVPDVVLTTGFHMIEYGSTSSEGKVRAWVSFILDARLSAVQAWWVFTSFIEESSSEFVVGVKLTVWIRKDRSHQCKGRLACTRCTAAVLCNRVI